jgi:hypothetical protein
MMGLGRHGRRQESEEIEANYGPKGTELGVWEKNISIKYTAAHCRTKRPHPDAKPSGLTAQALENLCDAMRTETRGGRRGRGGVMLRASLVCKAPAKPVRSLV